jgi:GT2 family glycosyltransferase
VVVSCQADVLTRLCVESVLENTDGPSFELVVVDNGSTDGSRAYLRTIERRFANVRLVLNDSNRGFPAASNQGLAVARGRMLVLLNNDTIVAPGWLTRLLRQADNPSVGLVGPTTNRIGNEAELFVEYQTYGQYLAVARARAERFDGAAVPIRMPAMFCVAFRRDVLEAVGYLDEQFGVGLLEDDDYAERVGAAGLRCLCCEDVFVHHFGEGTFGRLYASGDHGRLLAANRARFEHKWGKPWAPYSRRPQADYEHVRDRIREIVAGCLPVGSAVAVANRGDEEMIRFERHRGLHFPQTDEGVYAGRHPADDVEAIAELEAVRRRGADYFLLPRTSFWWLDHYTDLNRHVEGRYARVVDDDACIVFELGDAR